MVSPISNGQISKVINDISITLDRVHNKLGALRIKMKIQNKIIADLRAELATKHQKEVVRPRLARNQEIYDARNNGATFTELGYKYDLSTTRVQQIYRTHERMLKK